MTEKQIKDSKNSTENSDKKKSLSIETNNANNSSNYKFLNKPSKSSALQENLTINTEQRELEEYFSTTSLPNNAIEDEKRSPIKGEHENGSYRVVRCGMGELPSPVNLTHFPLSVQNEPIYNAKQFVEDYEEFHDSCSEIPDSQRIVGGILTELSSRVGNIIEGNCSYTTLTFPTIIENDNTDDDSVDMQPSTSSEIQNRPPSYNIFGLPSNIAQYPKVLYNKNYNSPLVEITDQNIEILHQNDEVCENNPEMVRPLVIPEAQQAAEKDQEIDEDDVYRPVAVSPCGRFFKYDEEVGRGSFKTVYKGKNL